MNAIHLIKSSNNNQSKIINNDQIIEIYSDNIILLHSISSDWK